MVALAVVLSIRADEPQPKPVEIQVIDEKSGEPVRQFTYRYGITSAHAADRDTCEEFEAVSSSVCVP
jgi:hypothetical protein